MNQSDLSHLPEGAQNYCYELWQEYDFQFKIARSRATKMGDYRYDRASRTGRVTVNNGLNPFAFLITFLHEVAHHLVAINSNRRLQPHGNEWKLAFSHLMNPLLNGTIFPPDLNLVLVRHMRNPRASTGADLDLWKALQKYNQRAIDHSLFDLPDLSTFAYRKRVFKKLQKKRTRVLCLEINTKRQYLIPGIVAVEPYE
jgi:hypothetical protein